MIGSVNVPGVSSSDITSINITLTNKVDKIVGKGLSTNDFTNEYKSKLDNISGSGTGCIICSTTQPTINTCLWIKYNNTFNHKIKLVDVDKAGFVKGVRCDTLYTAENEFRDIYRGLVINNSIYKSISKTSMNIWNLSNNSYTQKTVSWTYNASKCRFNNFIYSFGGHGTVDGDHYDDYTAYDYKIIQAYNVSTDTLTTKSATCADYTRNMSLISVGNYIYRFGGESDVGRYGGTHYSYKANYYSSNAMEMYDPSTDTITSVGLLPQGMYNMGIVAIGNIIYLLGGQSISGWYTNGASNNLTQNDYSTWTQAFDTTTNTRTTLSTTTAYGNYYNSTCINNQIISHNMNSSNPVNTFTIYDLDTNTLTTNIELLNVPVISGRLLQGENNDIYCSGYIKDANNNNQTVTYLQHLEKGLTNNLSSNKFNNSILICTDDSNDNMAPIFSIGDVYEYKNIHKICHVNDNANATNLEYEVI